MSTNPWIWLAAILTLFIFSYLWKENPLFRLAEHILVGIAAGYLLTIYWHNILRPNMWLPLTTDFRQNFFLLIPMGLALMMFFRLSKKYDWVSFWPMAFLIGFSGLAIPSIIDANMLAQIRATVNVPLNGHYSSMLNGFTILTGTFACLTYFYFSSPPSGIIRRISTFGSFFLMISFGAAFGLTVMARISLLIGRLMFLFRDWLGIIH